MRRRCAFGQGRWLKVLFQMDGSKEKRKFPIKFPSLLPSTWCTLIFLHPLDILPIFNFHLPIVRCYKTFVTFSIQGARFLSVQRIGVLLLLLLHCIGLIVFGDDIICDEFQEGVYSHRFMVLCHFTILWCTHLDSLNRVRKDLNRVLQDDAKWANALKQYKRENYPNLKLKKLGKKYWIHTLIQQGCQRSGRLDGNLE